MARPGNPSRSGQDDAFSGHSETLRATLAACPIGVAILARDDGRRLFVNAALVEMMGAESEAALMKDDIADTWVDPDRLKEAWSVFESGNNLVNFEAERRRIDGTRWWVLMNTQPVVFDGVPAGIVWHIDISPRKRAEEATRQSEKRFREAVDSLSDGFVLFDAADRMVFCNRMYRRLNPGLVPVRQQANDWVIAPCFSSSAPFCPIYANRLSQSRWSEHTVKCERFRQSPFRI